MTTNELHLPGNTDVPIVCDMSAAEDTPDERIAEWGELFDRALLGRERRPDSVVLSFKDESGTREQVEDLARRDHACCPFLDYRIETTGEGVRLTTSNVVTGEERASIDVFLDTLYDLPDQTRPDMASFTGDLADRGVNMVEAPAKSKRFELG